MAIEVKCEACGRTFKVNDELAGRRVRCSACSATLTVPGAGGAHGAGPSECPDCGNPLPAGAVLCVGCGYNLTTGTRAQMRKAPRTRRGLPKFTISLPGCVSGETMTMLSERPTCGPARPTPLRSCIKAHIFSARSGKTSVDNGKMMDAKPLYPETGRILSFKLKNIIKRTPSQKGGMARKMMAEVTINLSKKLSLR